MNLLYGLKTLPGLLKRLRSDPQSVVKDLEKLRHDRKLSSYSLVEISALSSPFVVVQSPTTEPSASASRATFSVS